MDAVTEMPRHIHGVDIAVYERAFLAKSIEKARLAAGEGSAADYLTRLSQDRAEAASFLRSLRVTYSEFFRNPLACALLEQVILPSLVKSADTAGREIRVWSAGCATGQEAWSIAILLHELAEAYTHPVSFRIFATDVSDDALALARRGVYDLADVQNARVKHFEQFFAVSRNSCEIIPALRAHVDFSAHDLLDERTVSPSASVYGDFDLLLCSNVLLYYRPETQQRILGRLVGAARAGGWVVTGEAERDIVARHPQLGQVAPPATVFQKRSNA